MKQGLLTWSNGPCPPLFILPTTFQTTKPIKPITFKLSATLESSPPPPSVNEKPLTARERRQLRNERRETKPTYNWREEVEERLIKKPKKRYNSWTEELNLDNLALLGPQWWVVRVSRVTGHETAERLARSMIRNFPHIDFQVYAPSVHVKRKLKNGTISVKPKPLFPGCLFLKCVLNKEIHDSIRECDGVGGFIGSKVGNTKRQINKPRPVDDDDMEAIFRQAKEEQEKADEAFEIEQKGELDSVNLTGESPLSGTDIAESVTSPKTKRRSGKTLQTAAGGPSAEFNDKLLKPGLTIQVVSGAFAGFSGILKKFDTKRKLATVGFTLFGKETLADIDVNEFTTEAE